MKHTVLHAIPAVLVEAIVCIADVITSWTPEDAPYAARLFWRGRRLRRVEITGFPSPESINCERSDVADAAVTVQQVMDYENGVWFWDETAGGAQ